jgi:toxin ParE1/3/4
MSRAIVLKRPQVEADLWEQAAHIAAGNVGAAERFLAAVEETFSLLAKQPLLGAAVRSRRAALADIRVWAVSDFRNWLIFYRPTDDGVEIVRVLHAARDWQAVVDAETS